MSYEFLEHTADVKFRAKGETLEKVFVESAKALFETIYGKLEIASKIEKEIEVDGEDEKSMLYDFLEEFLFLLDAEGLVFGEIKEISIKDFKLKAIVMGDKAENYNFTNDVKAVTYNEMKIEKKDDGGFEAVGVYDV